MTYSGNYFLHRSFVFWSSNNKLKYSIYQKILTYPYFSLFHKPSLSHIFQCLRPLCPQEPVSQSLALLSCLFHWCSFHWLPLQLVHRMRSCSMMLWSKCIIPKFFNPVPSIPVLPYLEKGSITSQGWNSAQIIQGSSWPLSFPLLSFCSYPFCLLPLSHLLFLTDIGK